MARFIITTKHVKNSNGIRIEPGMRVEVITQTMSNPVITNGGQVVVDAFMRIYGIDIKKAGCLNMVELDVQKIGLLVILSGEIFGNADKYLPLLHLLLI